MAGWTFFPHGGLISAFQKLNFLAHALQDLANTPANSVSLIQKGMEEIRTSVIQHQTVLDLLTAKDRGVCKKKK